MYRQRRAHRVRRHPDGRICETNEQCGHNVPDEWIGLEARCEHVGLFGTYSVESVCYRGKLQDPNEVAVTLNAGALSILISRSSRRKSFHVGAEQRYLGGIRIVLITDAT